ncbi:DUF4145 domain-containing protein [Patescibacteria group bacterium]|nr:DUF4145 domain-containing protein [Patescibacteria group bacterium]
MKLEFDKSKDEEIKLPCASCDNETYHKVLTSINSKESDEYNQYFEENQIVMCQGCKKISFRSNWQYTEDIDYFDDPITGEVQMTIADHITLYPSRLAGRKELKDIHYLPSEIYGIYKETHSALCSKMPILAGMGIRALIEAVCNDKKAIGKNLEEKIDNLIQMGILTKDGAEILHSTRLLGNQAVHEVKPLDEKTLDAAMDVAEYLLKGVYILPKKTEKLPKRK